MTAEEITRNYTQIHLNGLYFSVFGLLLFCFAGITLLLALGVLINGLKKWKKAIKISAIAAALIWAGVACFEKKEEVVKKELAEIEKEALVPFVNKLPLVKEDVAEFALLDKPVETENFFFPKGKKLTQVRIITKNKKGYKTEKEMTVEIVEIKGLTDELLVYKKLKEKVAYFPSGKYDAQLFVPQKK